MLYSRGGIAMMCRIVLHNINSPCLYMTTITTVDVFTSWTVADEVADYNLSRSVGRSESRNNQDGNAQHGALSIDDQ